MMQSKLAKDLVVGDKIIIHKTGEVVTLTQSEKGLSRDSKLLVWRGGWSCVDCGELIAVAN